MPLSKGIRRQLKISAWIIAIYCVALLIYLKGDVQRALMGGSAEEASQEAPYAEITWEVLVVDSDLRSKLWSRYDKSPEAERERAFLAVLHMMDSLSPDQAEHLAKNFLDRSGQSPNRHHRKKLLEMLERLGIRFDSAMSHIAHFASKMASAPLESQPRRKDVRIMMQNIALETKDTGYKFCLKGEDVQVKRCAERLLEEGHRNAIKHLQSFLKTSSSSTQKSEILVALAKNQVDEGRSYVQALLESGRPLEIKTGLRMVREYEMIKARPQVEKLRGSGLESIREDVDKTLMYLSTRHPAYKN